MFRRPSRHEFEESQAPTPSYLGGRPLSGRRVRLDDLARGRTRGGQRSDGAGRDVRSRRQALPRAELQALPQRRFDDFGRPRRQSRRLARRSANEAVGSRTHERRDVEDAAARRPAADPGRPSARCRLDHAGPRYRAHAAQAEERRRAALDGGAIPQHFARPAGPRRRSDRRASSRRRLERRVREQRFHFGSVAAADGRVLRHRRRGARPRDRQSGLQADHPGFSRQPRQINQSQAARREADPRREQHAARRRRLYDRSAHARQAVRLRAVSHADALPLHRRLQGQRYGARLARLRQHLSRRLRRYARQQRLSQGASLQHDPRRSAAASGHPLR